MAVAREGTGLATTARAVASQVHPVFMLPPLATSLFGGLLAGGGEPVPAAVHVVAVFAAVYTAHVKDGYVDFYVRHEDDGHPLTPRGCTLALLASTAVFAFACLALAVTVDGIASALTLPTWLIAYHHAPQLDTNPVTATTGYPVGIALALVGGYYAQAGTVRTSTVALALVFVAMLSGIKVIDDAQDYAYDRSIDKRTVAVVLGPERAIEGAYALLAVAMAAVFLLVATAVLPPTTVLAAIAFVGVAGVARRAPPALATMLLIRGSYVFIAVLVAAVWFEPLT